MQCKRGVILGIAGEVHHVDSGYYVVGMKRPDAPDSSLSNSLSRE
jgi:enoyl-[acyl-carrier protein] reductase I